MQYKDDVPPRYADTGVRPSRARLDYELGGASQYADTYSDRFVNLGFEAALVLACTFFNCVVRVTNLPVLCW